MNYRIAWLAGFVDGEGHISVHGNGERWYQATIGIRNTCKRTLDEVSADLDTLGIKHGLYSDKRSGNSKDSYWLNVSGMENVLVLAELLRPHSITKVRQLDLIADWCRSRLSKPKGAYTERELEIANEFKYINRRGQGVRG